MFFLKKIFNSFSHDLGIDLGTANTLIYVNGKGIVLREPSVVALKASTKKVLAVGNEARNMIGRTPSDIIAIKPMQDGVIADFDIVEEMIRYLIKKVHNGKMFIRPRVAVGIPSGITEVEKRAVREAAEKAGAREIYLIEESFAAAIGANIPIHEAFGNMIIDIGGGTTEVSVISLGGVVTTNSIRVGGNRLDQTLIQYFKKHYNLIIGERSSEEIKMKIGTAYCTKKGKIRTMQVRGRSTINGLPQILEVDNLEINQCLQEPLNQILAVVKETLDQTPPELAADIHERGIIMTGGGSLLSGLPQFIARETVIPITLSERPLDCVALGAGRFLEEMHKFNYNISA